MKFRNYLTEAKDQLDISIQAAAKYLTSDAKKDEFVSTGVTVEMKYDGVKITLVYIDNTGDYTKDWIVSYKGEIQYPDEFDFASTDSIKKSSIANAQFKLVFEHLKKITPGLSGIKKDTEFFIEMLMKKPTLSSNYSKHGMIIIAAAPCTWEDNFGKLKTTSTFDTSTRSKYSKILDIPEPTVIFDGVLGSQSTFENSIKVKELKSVYNEFKSTIVWDDPDSIIKGVSEMFLSLDSKYGNHKEEGVVIIYKDGSRILKFQQSYQVDQEARKVIKARFKEPEPETENNYWDLVRLNALNIISVVTRGKLVKYVDFPDVLEQCAKSLKKLKLTFTHSKKNTLQIKDDIQGNIKMILRKNLKGNNNFLFLGKFRVLSTAHYKIIKDGLKKYDGGVVCVVTSKDTKHTKDLRTEMVRKAFPEIEIVHHSTGNLFGIMGKATKNINVVLAGSDRVSAYKSTLSRNPDLSVEETKRTGSDISATKIIENINDEKYFKKNTPKAIHSLYGKILKEYGAK
jgi:nicotinamide mononucleotide adenylyltransferase